MQVNNFNNNLSPNFGMALRIKPEAAKGIEERLCKMTSSATQGTVDKIGHEVQTFFDDLSKIGEEIKNTKHFDLSLEGEFATPVIRSKDSNFSFKLPYKISEPNKGTGIVISGRHAGLDVSGLEEGVSVEGDGVKRYLKFEDNQAAQEAYNKLKVAGKDKRYNGLFSMLEYLKIMESCKERVVKLQSTISNMNNEIRNNVTKLVQDYGVKQ